MYRTAFLFFFSVSDRAGRSVKLNFSSQVSQHEEFNEIWQKRLFHSCLLDLRFARFAPRWGSTMSYPTHGHGINCLSYLPIVAVKEAFQSSWQNRWIKLDLPTPESPTKTTLNTRSGVECPLPVDAPASLVSRYKEKIQNHFSWEFHSFQRQGQNASSRNDHGDDKRRRPCKVQACLHYL